MPGTQVPSHVAVAVPAVHLWRSAWPGMVNRGSPTNRSPFLEPRDRPCPRTPRSRHLRRPTPWRSTPIPRMASSQKSQSVGSRVRSVRRPRARRSCRRWAHVGWRLLVVVRVISDIYFCRSTTTRIAGSAASRRRVRECGAEPRNETPRAPEGALGHGRASQTTEEKDDGRPDSVSRSNARYGW